MPTWRPRLRRSWEGSSHDHVRPDRAPPARAHRRARGGDRPRLLRRHAPAHDAVSTAAALERPERWLPMGVIARPIPIRPLPWRPIAVAALITLLAAATLIYAGSRARVPAPFGPARNGVIVYGTRPRRHRRPGPVHERDQDPHRWRVTREVPGVHARRDASHLRAGLGVHRLGDRLHRGRRRIGRARPCCPSGRPSGGSTCPGPATEPCCRGRPTAAPWSSRCSTWPAAARHHSPWTRPWGSPSACSGRVMTRSSTSTCRAKERPERRSTSRIGDGGGTLRPIAISPDAVNEAWASQDGSKLAYATWGRARDSRAGSASSTWTRAWTRP